MKTNKKNLILFVMFIFGFTAMGSAGATENLEVIRIEKTKKVRLELSAPAEAPIDVMLFNANDRVLYRDQISAGATFEDQFDFSTVRNGTYRIVSELGNKRYNRVFRVSEDAVEFMESFYSFVPQFKIDNKMLLVHYLKSPQESVGISIEDETGRVYDAYYDNQEFVFSNAYGLDGLQPGAYVISLMSGLEQFTYAFEIE